ncbi:hypothetical protein JCM1840_004132 [Sporobolomyces johnsonii]
MSNSPDPALRSASPSNSFAATLAAPFLCRALHSFSPSSIPSSPAETGTCLSFEQGQIIRCLNQDQSGWWDGELDGRRGWFPSNYVELLRGDPPPRSPSRSPTRSRSRAHPHARSGAQLSPEATTLLSSIEQNVGLLENAVRSARKGHYQPSTACVISSIRTVLSSTQSLTRDSPILRQHPSLSSSRKRILSSLASLVEKARKASAPEEREPARERDEAEAMLAIARETVGFVRGFLEEAERRGVAVNLGLGAGSTSPLVAQPAEGGGPLRGAKSTGDLRSRRPTLEALEQPLPSTTFPVVRPSPAPSAVNSPQFPAGSSFSSSSNPPPVLRTPSALSQHLSTLHDSLLSTIAALIGHIHSHSRSSSPASSFAQLIDLTREGIERVRDVLEVVEAVGAKAGDHGKGKGKHKETTDDRVQDDEVKVLAATRERLYVATTALVTAARIATSPLPAAKPVPTHEEEEDERKGLLGAATGVLRAGGDCVGAVKLVGGKLFSGEGGAAFELALPKARKPSEYEGEDVDDDAAAAAVKFADPPSPSDPDAAFEASPPRRARNPHTLSMLGRKATSLGCLRGRFEQDATTLEEEGPEAEEGGEHDETPTGAPEVERGVVELPEANSRPVKASSISISPSHAPSSSSSSAPATMTLTRSASDDAPASAPRPSSIPMSRNVSSGSGSNTGSIASRTTSSSVAGTHVTGETSPRSSYGTSRGAKFASGGSTGSNGGVPPLPTGSGQGRGRTSTRPSSGGKAPGHTRSSLSVGRSSLSGASSPSPSSVSANSNGTTTSLGSPLFSPNPATSTLTLTPSIKSLSPERERKNGKVPPPSGNGAPVPWFLERDYPPREISFNADGHVTGGTLRVLIERMTLHDTTIDATFSATFLLTFRLFTTPRDLANALYRRFDLAPPRHPETGDSLSADELKHWTSVKLTPIRLRIYNLFKTWLEAHWQHDPDVEIAEGLREWCRGRLRAAMPAASTRLVDLVEKRVLAAERDRRLAEDRDGEVEGRPSNASETSMSSGFSGAGMNGSTTSLALPAHMQNGAGGGGSRLMRMASTERLKAGKPLVPFSSLSPVMSNSSTSLLPTMATANDPYSPHSPTAMSAPSPVVTKALLSMLRSPSGRTPSITDIDPLELARQLTIMESRVYCSIRPEELLGSSSGSGGGSGKREGSVRKMSALSTRLTGWIAETILGESDQKKRTYLVKYFVKLGDRLLALSNYNALFAVFTALNSSTIIRLRKTWDGLAPKYKAILEVLRRATDHSRNYAEYRGKIRQTVPPCLPFVGLFLTDLIFIFEGNRAERPSPVDPSLRLINFDRYQKMARIVSDLQRFQVPYALVEVPELQALLASVLEGPLKSGQDAQSLYRQSLLIEPRSQAPSLANGGGSVDARSHRGHDVFNWRG